MDQIKSEDVKRAERLVAGVSEDIREWARSLWAAEVREIETGQPINRIPTRIICQEERPTREQIQAIARMMHLAATDERYGRIRAYHEGRGKRRAALLSFDEWYSAALAYSPVTADEQDRQTRQADQTASNRLSAEAMAGIVSRVTERRDMMPVFNALDAVKKRTGGTHWKAVLQQLHEDGFEQTQKFEEWKEKFYGVTTLLDMKTKIRTARRKAFEMWLSRVRVKWEEWRRLTVS